MARWQARTVTSLVDNKQANGAVVAGIGSGSPAATAGLQSKDIIVAVNGQPVRDGTALRNIIGLTPVGTKIQLHVLRNGQALDLSATVGEAAAPAEQQAQPS